MHIHTLKIIRKQIACATSATCDTNEARKCNPLNVYLTKSRQTSINPYNIYGIYGYNNTYSIRKVSILGAATQNAIHLLYNIDTIASMYVLLIAMEKHTQKMPLGKAFMRHRTMHTN